MITQTTRGDAPLSLRWGWWHNDCFLAAYQAEQPEGEWRDLFDPGYTYTEAHSFTDPADGEVLNIQPGDTFSWWWN